MIENGIACLDITQKIDKRNLIGLRARERAHNEVEISRGKPRPTIRPDHRDFIMRDTRAYGKSEILAAGKRKSGILPDSASRRLAGRVELEAQLPKRSSICGRRLRIQNFLCPLTMANTQANATAERWRSSCAASLSTWVTAIARTAGVIQLHR